MNHYTKYFTEIQEQIEKYKAKKLKIFASSSFQTQSVVLLHILSKIDNSIPIYFLNTGYHFPETLSYKERLTKLFRINVTDLFSSVPKNQQRNGNGNLLFTSDPDYCCYLNKVQPMEPVLKEKDVWISGVRADQNANRQKFNIEDRAQHNVIRYHPMLNWTSKMIYGYIKENDLPKHPLDENGYMSIGCLPCTKKIEINLCNNNRAGRWFGMNKTECGIHTDLIVKE